MILNTRIGTATQTEHLPTCHSIRPLEGVYVCVWGGGWGGGGGVEDYHTYE